LRPRCAPSRSRSAGARARAEGNYARRPCCRTSACGPTAPPHSAGVALSGRRPIARVERARAASMSAPHATEASCPGRFPLREGAMGTFWVARSKAHGTPCANCSARNSVLPSSVRCRPQHWLMVESYRSHGKHDRQRRSRHRSLVPPSAATCEHVVVAKVGDKEGSRDPPRCASSAAASIAIKSSCPRDHTQKLRARSAHRARNKAP